MYVFGMFLILIGILCTLSAITIGVRILGPAAGFILGSFCTRIYVDLSIDPMITPQDPKWVGAWWLGKFMIFFTTFMQIKLKFEDQQIFFF